MTAVAPCGYVIAIREMTITIIPNPILARRDLPLPIIPETTFSIPAKNNRSARMKITETPPITGLSNTSIDRIKITAPRPIWAILYPAWRFINTQMGIPLRESKLELDFGMLDAKIQHCWI